MCGIAGFYSQDTAITDNRPLDRAITAMLAQITHRGPDEAGIYFDDKAALGTVRLSVIDLAHGQQPMQLGNRYIFSYNGEIFNYPELRKELEQQGEIFTTDCDTEVAFRALLRWGPDALTRFDGHFALSLYDREEESFLLARDPFGEKPLFFIQNERYFAFSSEMKAFGALDFFQFEPDSASLNQIAWFWTLMPGASPFKEISSIRPGHFLTVRNGQLNQKPYYTLPPFRGSEVIGEREAQEELQRLLKKSITRRLRSDVEVGAYLSGGLDSTIVTCLAREQIQERLKTFSIAFDDPAFDESRSQQEVADFLGTAHHALKISAADIVDNFATVIEHTELPLFRTAPVPMFILSRFVHDEGIKVVLTGEGSDEFFIGYDLYKETLFRAGYDAFDSDKSRIKNLVSLYPYLPHFTEAKAAKLLNYFKNHTDPDLPFFSHRLRFASGRLAAQLLADRKPAENFYPALEREMGIIAGSEFNALSKLEQAQLLELGTLLQGYLLSSQGDRMTSANSIEGRCPFLSTELVAFAQRLPQKMKLDGGTEKKILRDSFSDQIPKAISVRRKQPYRAPDAAPFLSDTAYMNDYIKGALLPSSTIINPDFARKFLDKIARSSIQNISPREDQAFVFLISTLIWEKKFCRGNANHISRNKPLKVRIDGRKSDFGQARSA